MSSLKTICIASVLVCSAFLVTLYSACIKNPFVGNKSHHISGTFYYDCNGVPYANKSVSLVLKGSTSDCNYQGGTTTTTDSNGYFYLSYEDGGCTRVFDSRKLYLTTDSCSLPVSIDNSNDYGAIYIRPNKQLNVHIHVNSNHSRDTLFCGINSHDFSLIHLYPVHDTSIFIAANNLVYSLYWNLSYSDGFTFSSDGSSSATISKNCPQDSVSIVIP